MTTTVTHLMSAAHPIAALAARVGSDEEFVGQLTHAVHQNDKATLQQLLASAGAKGATVTIEQKAGAGAQKTIISVHLDLGPIHISVDVKK